MFIRQSKGGELLYHILRKGLVVPTIFRKTKKGGKKHD
jgi:hypothetical protein